MPGPQKAGDVLTMPLISHGTGAVGLIDVVIIERDLHYVGFTL